MVLPFAGLEIALVGLGMYYASWKLSVKEIIIIEGDSLTLQKGVYFPKQQWDWQRRDTILIKRPSKYRADFGHYCAKFFSQTFEPIYRNRRSIEPSRKKGAS